MINRPISPARLAANRQNASKSTGPRTGAGKQRSSKNALRHGLAIRNYAGLADALEDLACADTLRAALALEVVTIIADESWNDLLRIKEVRGQVLNAAYERAKGQGYIDPEYIFAAAMEFASYDVSRLDEYERKALSINKKAHRALIEASEHFKSGLIRPLPPAC